MKPPHAINLNANSYVKYNSINLDDSYQTSFSDIASLSSKIRSKITAPYKLEGYLIHKKILGEGQFGKVRLVTHLKTSQFAVLKVVNKIRLRNENDKHLIRNEINSMKLLRHENIARLLHLIEDNDNFYIIREYCSNGDLYDYVEKKGKLSEKESRKIFHDLICCLDYMHERGFTHRDIRPENVLIDSTFRIKLIGFRHAHLRLDNESDLATLKTHFFSPEYTAPEVLTGSVVCSPSIDVWSAGVLLYFMLTGTLPFTDENLARLLRKIQSGVFQLQSELHDDVRDLIIGMLKVDPVERANVKQILPHQWLQLCELPLDSRLAPSEERLDEDVLNECYELHSHEVEDKVQLRFNIHYKYCYQTASYWLIKENYKSFKKHQLNCYSKVPEDRQIRNLDLRQSNGSHYTRHTFIKSFGAPISSKIDIIQAQSTKSVEKYAITASLTSADRDRPSGNKKQCELERTSENYASIVNLAEHVRSKPVNDDQMWPPKSKSHFNLRRIFSKSRVVDERSNSIKSIASEYDNDESCQQVLSQMSLKKSLMRRFSFALPTKLLGKNVSRINSTISINKQDPDVTSKRAWHSPKDQSKSSLADTTDSDEKRVNLSKTIRFSFIDSGEFDQVDCPARIVARTPNKSSDLNSLDGIDPPNRISSVENESKINRYQSNSLSTKSCSVAIITRYSNYLECREEARSLLIKKGINCKAEKHKLRCSISTMNKVIVAFKLYFITSPKLCEGTFVTIKVKKILGTFEDFNVISTYLTRHFERQDKKQLKSGHKRNLLSA